MKKKKRRVKKGFRELVETLHKQAGRLEVPAPKVFRDKSKYKRKEKYQGTSYEVPFFYLSFPNIKVF